jgi:hypothetical protein
MAGIVRRAATALFVCLVSLACAAAASADPVERALSGADAPAVELVPRGAVAAPSGGRIERYAQRVDGVPVLGAEAIVAAPPGAPPMLVTDTTARDVEATPEPDSAISRGQAVDSALAFSDAERLRAPARAKLGIDPVSGRLAWEVALPSRRPLADYIVTVDARSGRALRSRDVLQRASASAMIFNPNPVVEQNGWQGLKDRNDKDSDLLTGLRLPATLERITSTKGCLVGTYVDARQGKKAKPVCSPTFDFSGLTRSDNDFEAVMAYFHIDRTRAYADGLGLSEALRGKPQKVRANGIPDDNSYYSSLTHSMTLGSGGVDDGEDADVIVHEYGHSLQDQAAPGFGRTRQGATIGEGFGDYMAAAMSSLTTGPSPWDACIFDWDGISYSPTGCGRVANRTFDLKKAERRCDKEIHCVGEVWSSMLLELRNALGTDTTGRSMLDRDLLESNFMLSSRSGFKDAARALINADQLLYGGANRPTLEAALVARRFCGAAGC